MPLQEYPQCFAKVTIKNGKYYSETIMLEE